MCSISFSTFRTFNGSVLLRICLLFFYCSFNHSFFFLLDHAFVGPLLLALETVWNTSGADSEKPKDSPFVGVIGHGQVKVSIAHDVNTIRHVGACSVKRQLLVLVFWLGDCKVELGRCQADVFSCHLLRHKMNRDFDLIISVELIKRFQRQNYLLTDPNA